MTAHELLTELRAKGVAVSRSGDDRLLVDAPKGTITEDLRKSLAAHKTELLEMLKEPSIVEPEAEAALVPEPLLPVRSLEPAGPVAEHTAIVASVAEEITQLQSELTRLKAEEAGRRAEVEAEHLAAEQALRAEQEKWRQNEEEIARRRAEHERKRIDAEARERAEEEKRRELADEEIQRAQQQLARMRSVEELRRREVDEQVRAAKAAHEAGLLNLRQAEEEQMNRRAEQERRFLETEARKRAQEDELRRRAANRFRAVEEEIERVQVREQARLRATQEAQRLADEAEQRRSEEEARRRAEEQARLRAEEESRLRADIEAQLRAEAAEKRRVEEEARHRAEEEARRRAEEQAQQLAAEKARRLAEEEAQRRAEEEDRRRLEEADRLKAEAESKRQAEEQARLRAAQEERERATAAARDRVELEARIRAEIEAQIQAEDAERHRLEAETRQRGEHERLAAEPAARAAAGPDNALQTEPLELDEPFAQTTSEARVTEIDEWFDVGLEERKEIVAVEPEVEPLPADDFGPLPDASGGEFRAVSVPEENSASGASISADIGQQLSSSKPAERAAAVGDLPRIGGEEAFRHISEAFDDQFAEVRSAAARALFELHEDRAAAFTRALREATPERRRRIGSAIATSGLANEAIRNLTGESRDKTYDAFSLLFLMSKAGEVQPLMRAIEEHPNIEVRLAVVKLLALSGQPDILPSFRRMAVRGSLPPEVRSAVMEAIYQISSQSPAETSTTK